MVDIQLKSLIAVGTPTSMVITENKIPANSDCPLTNMWCPHTRKLTAAIAKLEYAMAVYPKIVFLEKVEINSLTIHIAGKTMM